MPIPDVVAGPQTKPEPLIEDYYPLQNAYLRALIELSEAEEKYIRHEIEEAEVKHTRISAETVLLALEKHWACLDAQNEKGSRK